MRLTPTLTQETVLRETWLLLRSAELVLVECRMGSHFRVVIDRPTMISLPKGTSGRELVVRFEQDTVGYAVTFDGSVRTAPAVSATAGVVTFVRFLYDELGALWDVVPAGLTQTQTDVLYAPIGAGYIVDASSAVLTGERVLTDGVVVWDFATPGQVVGTVPALPASVLVGTVAVVNGGTQATTAHGARDNLFIGYNLDNQTTAVPSQSNTVENDLMTFTIPALRLITLGDRITFRMVFAFSAGIANKQVRIRWDPAGANQIIYDTGSLAVASKTLVVTGEIARSGAATQVIITYPSGDFTVFSAAPLKTTGTATLSGSIILKATSQQGVGAAAGDVVQHLMPIDYIPFFS